MGLGELGPPAGKTSKLDSCKGPSFPSACLSHQVSQSLLAFLPPIPLSRDFCLMSDA